MRATWQQKHYETLLMPFLFSSTTYTCILAKLSTLKDRMYPSSYWIVCIRHHIGSYRKPLILNCEGTKSMPKLVLAKVLYPYLCNLRDLALRHMRQKPSAGFLIFHRWRQFHQKNWKKLKKKFWHFWFPVSPYFCSGVEY